MSMFNKIKKFFIGKQYAVRATEIREEFSGLHKTIGAHSTPLLLPNIPLYEAINAIEKVQIYAVDCKIKFKNGKTRSFTVDSGASIYPILSYFDPMTGKEVVPSDLSNFPEARKYVLRSTGKARVGRPVLQGKFFSFYDSRGNRVTVQTTDIRELQVSRYYKSKKTQDFIYQKIQKIDHIGDMMKALSRKIERDMYAATTAPAEKPNPIRDLLG